MAITSLIVMMLAFAGPVGAVVPAPAELRCGQAVVDGNSSEWDVPGSFDDWTTSADFMAYMYRAWKPDKEKESALFMRYDLPTQTAYVLVLAAPGVPGIKSADEAWVSITDTPGDINHKVVSGGSGNDGVPPDFTWIDVNYDGNPNHVRGFEASFHLAPTTSTYLGAHLEVYDDNAPQTSGIADKTLQIKTGCTVDYGDLPDGPYPTLLTSNGPRHTIVSGVQLGAAVEAEADGQPNATATGDDLAGAADEDGVVFLTPLVAGKPANVQVTVADPDDTGFVSLFIDFNGDGTLDPVTYTAIDSVPGAGTVGDLALSSGVHTLTISVPPSATGVMGVRARLTDNAGEGGASPTGLAASGEVEDYLLATLGDYVWLDTNPNYVQDVTEAGAEGVTVKLLDGSGMQMKDGLGADITTLTDANGKYEFAGLPPGSYIVQFMKPDDYDFTEPLQGGEPALDSDADTDPDTFGMSGPVPLVAGQNNPTIDAGLKSGIPTAVSLAGFSARGGNAPWGGLAMLGLTVVGLAVFQRRRRR